LSVSRIHWEFENALAGTSRANAPGHESKSRRLETKTGKFLLVGSHAEFTAKIGVVLDESDESELWLSVVRTAEISKSPAVDRRRDEAMQFVAIFNQSSVTATSRQ
jgi:hypothetical protein